MESVLGRHRNLIIFLGVLFLQLLGLAVQVKRGKDAENTRLIRVWAVDAVTPLERGLVWAQNGSGNLWHNYFYLRGVRAENRQLKEQIDHMRLEEVRLNEDAAQAHRLQSLLAFKEQFISKTVAAQVIGSSGSDQSRSIYIDKGSDDGIKPDLAVITANGIVGKVWRVYASTALVLMIDDQSSGVGVILEKSRLQGVLKGTPNGQVALERVMSDEQVTPGEMVLTSGGDQIFPKGLPVGTVMKVGSGKDLFLNITVKPTANLSQLEEVLVVIEKQEQAPVVQDTGRMRAVDILAERLPSVPDKPVDAKVGAATSGDGAAGTAPAVSNSVNSVTKTAALAGGQPTGVGAPKTSPAPLKAVVPQTTSDNSSVKSSGVGGSSGSSTAASSAVKTAKFATKSTADSAKPAGAQPNATSNAQPNSPTPTNHAQPPAADGSPQ